jgi:hypothetical protein
LEATRARSRGTWAWPRWLPNSSTRSSRSPAASSALSSSASGTCRAPTRRPSPSGEKCGASSCQPPGGSRRAGRPAPPGTPGVSDEAGVDAEEHQAAAGPQHPLDFGEHRRDVVHVGVHVGEHDRADRGVTHREPGHVRAHQVLQAPPPAHPELPGGQLQLHHPAAGPLDRGRMTAAAAGQVQAPALAGAEQPGEPGGAAVRTRSRPATGDLVVPLCDRVVAAHRAAPSAEPHDAAQPDPPATLGRRPGE